MKTKLMISAATITDIINFVYKETFFSGYSHSFYNSSYIGNEIFSEYLLKLCEQPVDKMIDLFNRGEFNYYSARMIKNLVYYKYSKVNKEVINVKFNELDDSLTDYEYDVNNSPDSYEVDGLKSKIDVFLDEYVENNEGAWYEVMLFRMHYYEKLTFREMSRQTKIPFTSLHQSVTNVKNMVQSQFGDDYNDVAKNNN